MWLLTDEKIKDALKEIWSSLIKMIGNTSSLTEKRLATAETKIQKLVDDVDALKEKQK